MYYAGIGSRKTPPSVCWEIMKLAGWLSRKGWHLRTGGAKGADHAFAEGTERDRCMLYLPWFDYGGPTLKPSIVLTENQRENCIEVASKIHPNWKACSSRTQLLHARNVAIVLGPTLDSHVEFVVCWTSGGSKRGGTGMGLRIAEEYGIPIKNFAFSRRHEIERWVLGQSKEAK